MWYIHAFRTKIVSVYNVRELIEFKISLFEKKNGLSLWCKQVIETLDMSDFNDGTTDICITVSLIVGNEVSVFILWVNGGTQSACICITVNLMVKHQVSVLLQV